MNKASLPLMPATCPINWLLIAHHVKCTSKEHYAIVAGFFGSLFYAHAIKPPAAWFVSLLGNSALKDAYRYVIQPGSLRYVRSSLSQPQFVPHGCFEAQRLQSPARH
jgi:membrane-associated phospholipid phosphatase